MTVELQAERTRLKNAYRQQIAAAALLGTSSMANNSNDSTNSINIAANGGNTVPTTSTSAAAVAAAAASRLTRRSGLAQNGSGAGDNSAAAPDSKLDMLFNSGKAMAGNASSALLSGLPMGVRNGNRRKPVAGANSGAVVGAPLEQVLPEGSMR